MRKRNFKTMGIAGCSIMQILLMVMHWYRFRAYHKMYGQKCFFLACLVQERINWIQNQWKRGHKMHQNIDIRHFTIDYRSEACYRSIIVAPLKILLDVHEGSIIGNYCAQYEWNLFSHVWVLAAERSPYVKYREIPIFPPVGHLGSEIQNEATCINGP